jgi:hypothetical protein
MPMSRHPLWHGCVLAAVAGLLAMSALAADPGWQQQLDQDGLRVTLSLQPLDATGLRAGAPARLRATVTGSDDGAPVRTLPGIWLDGLQSADGAADDAAACQRRVARYARGTGINPQSLVDLNGYDVLALNADASISVLDPRVQFAGKTSLRATLALPGPGFDWAASPDERWLWVSVPSANALALADLDALRTLPAIALPGPPGRVRVEPGGARAWAGVAHAAAGGSGSGSGSGNGSAVAAVASVGAGSPGAAGAAGGIAVVDAAAPHRLQWLPLARGHVEMAFDPSGWVAVTQREAAEVVFIDPTTLQVVRRSPLPATGGQGPMPLNVVFDAVARRFVVAEARAGVLHAFDHRGQPQGTLALAPGIGPMTLSPDGRWLLVANPARHQVEVVDLASLRHAHRIPVSGRPYDIGATPGYAYVRALDSEAVSLIAWPSLAETPRVQAIAMGERAPGRTPQLPLAAPQAAMLDGSGGFIASPGDNAIYFYMEGMNAPAGSVSARGHELRAVRIARRGLRETTPGVYETQFTLPAATQLMLAVATESPRTRQCTPLALAAESAASAPAWQLAWEQLPVRQGVLALRIEGTPDDALPAAVPLRLFQPGAAGLQVLARAQGQGRYRAELPALAAGRLYVHPSPPPGSRAQWGYTSFIRTAGAP